MHTRKQLQAICVIALTFALGTLAACGGDKPPSRGEDSGSRAGDQQTTPPPEAEAVATETRAPDLPLGEPAVYIVGLDDFPERTLARLQTFFRQEHGIEVGILPSIPVDPSAYDPERQQLVADRLLEAIYAARAPGDERAVIGLTEYDIMMLDRPDWAFVFSLRDESLGLAVVSVARMDPRSFGERRDDDLLFDRAAKMVGKNVGVMYLGLPMSQDPRSVMYDRLYSLDALDTVDDDFRLASAP